MQKNNKWKTILAIMLRFLCGVPLFCPSPDLREKRLTELKDQKSTGRGKVRKMVPVISHPTRLFGGGVAWRNSEARTDRLCSLL